MKILTLLASFVLAVMTMTAADAATIWTNKGDIYIKGDIEDSDYANFKRLATNLPRGTTVVMKSEGGKLVEGLNIGIMIRTKQFRTVVVDICASTCSFMWLAGLPRAAFSDAEIGFHGAFSVKLTENGTSSEVRVSSNGNALVGAYLARLGFSYELINLITSAAPDDMNWLEFKNAKKFGIDMTVVPTTRPKN